MSDKNLQPVMQKALGEDWNKLSSIVKRHYDITPGQPCEITIKGVMDEVYHSRLARLFLLPARLFGALVPYRGQNIPTEVHNWTQEEDHVAMYWHRTLYFPNKPPLIFRSRMEHVNDADIIEFVRYGMGIRMRMPMSTRHGALVFKSKTYVWKIGKFRIPIPAWMSLGEAEIEEKALSDKEFYISFNIVHPLFGRTFSY